MSADKEEYGKDPIQHYRKEPDGTIQYPYEPPRTIEDLLREQTKLLKSIDKTLLDILVLSRRRRK